MCRYFREGYLNAMAELIQRELQKFDNPEKTEIFFSAHGVPVSYVEQVRLNSAPSSSSLRYKETKHVGETWKAKSPSRPRTLVARYGLEVVVGLPGITSQLHLSAQVSWVDACPSIGIVD